MNTWIKRHLLLLKLAKNYRKPKSVQTLGQGLNALRYVSTLSIALCVAGLVVALSLLRGFEASLFSERLKAVMGDGVLRAPPPPELNLCAAHSRRSDALLRCPKVPGQAILLRGLSPNETEVTDVGRYLEGGDWSTFTSGTKKIVIGAILAQKLNIQPGESLTLILHKNARPFCVTVTLHAILRSNTFMDNFYAAVPLSDLDTYLPLQHQPHEWTFKVHNIKQRPAVVQALRDRKVLKYTWDERLYSDKAEINTIKRALVMSFGLIMLLACFTISATLSMSISSWGREIAILRSVGASSRFICKLFMVIGLIDATIGGLAGILLGGGIAALIPSLLHYCTSDYVELTSCLVPLCTAGDVLGVLLLLQLVALAPLYYLARVASRTCIVKGLH